MQPLLFYITQLDGNSQRLRLGLTPPAGLTVELEPRGTMGPPECPNNFEPKFRPMRLGPAACLPSVPVSTTPEPPWAVPSSEEGVKRFAAAKESIGQPRFQQDFQPVISYTAYMYVKVADDSYVNLEICESRTIL